MVGAAFGSGTVETFRPRIQRVVDDLLDAVRCQGQIDLIADLAYPLPAIIIAELLDVPIADREMFKAWSDDISVGAMLSGPTLERAHHGQTAMTAYCEKLIARRHTNLGDDLLSVLITHQQHGLMSQDELVATCVFLLFAGHETTTNMIGNACLALLEHPWERRRLARDPALTRPALEELTRYDSPVQAAYHRAAIDFELNGERVREGDPVLLLLGAANRDPDQFADPDRLDLSRSPNRHLGFGAGFHFCMGAGLARLEGQIALQTLFTRFPRLELATSELEWVPNVLFRGLESLPVWLNN
ncbi:MAG: hypothetical protein NVSMB2_19750 [Chloroflexota bacterium]